MSDNSFKTAVEQLYRQELCNHRILHGKPESEVLIASEPGYTHKKSFFLPNKVIFYERWSKNSFGTISWEIFAGKTSEPLREIQSIPGIHPGIELYLQVRGKNKVKILFQFLDELVAKKIDPCSLIEAHLRFLHDRIYAGLPITAVLNRI